MTSRMSDERLDREIRAFLDWHAGDVSAAPLATEVAMRIAHSQRPRTFGGRAMLPAPGRGLAIAVALLALLAVLFAMAAILGSRLLPSNLDAPVWLPAGTTIEPHEDHTATALPNGTVLIAGGLLGENLKVTELFDPVTLSWTRTGDLSWRHGETTATLLSDGRVLLAGVGQAEAYDSRMGTWTATGRMIEERYGHTATLLPDGRVLIAGGVHAPSDRPGGLALANAELFDPATGKWEATGAMADARHGHTATLLPNGLVLVAGGIRDNPADGTAASLPSAELYDPATGTWTTTGPMKVRRAAHTATLLSNGLVLVAGGNRDRYHRSRPRWRPPSCTTQRSEHGRRPGRWAWACVARGHGPR